MNELDYILIAIILIGVGVGLRRGLVRVVISIVGIYFTVIVTGYFYRPIGDTLAGALGRLGIRMASVSAYNLTYVVGVIALTVAVEVISRSTFEETRIRSLRGLDNVLGGIVGIFYGALWASLFLVPSQYSIAQAGSVWTASVRDSELVPMLNRMFNNVVLDIVSIFFAGNIPRLFLNEVSQRVSYLFLNLA